MSKRKDGIRDYKLMKEWESHVNRWKTSGLSQKEFCRRNGLIKNRFVYWKLKLDQINKSNKIKKKDNDISLVQVKTDTVSKLHHRLPIINSSDYEMRINIDNRYQVEVKNNFKPESLRRLVLILRNII